jgi:hypothetical protein
LRWPSPSERTLHRATITSHVRGKKRKKHTSGWENVACGTLNDRQKTWRARTAIITAPRWSRTALSADDVQSALLEHYVHLQRFQK